MKKQTIVWVLVVIIILLGLWWYFGAKSPEIATNAPVATSTSQSVSTSTNPNTSQTKMSLSSIFGQSGSNIECLYEQVGTSTMSSYKIDISGNKMRGEFKTTTRESVTLNHLVYDGSYAYSWKEGATVGTRSSRSSVSAVMDMLPDDLGGKVIGSSPNNVSWDCHAWSPNTALLVKPSYVVFK